MIMTDQERIEAWEQKAKENHNYMTINVSSWHMSIFPEFHENIDEVKEKLLHEKQNPAGYSITRLTYDLKNKKIIEI